MPPSVVLTAASSEALLERTFPRGPTRFTPTPHAHTIVERATASARNILSTLAPTIVYCQTLQAFVSKISSVIPSNTGYSSPADSATFYHSPHKLRFSLLLPCVIFRAILSIFLHHRRDRSQNPFGQMRRTTNVISTVHHCP